MAIPHAFGVDPSRALADERRAHAVAQQSFAPAAVGANDALQASEREAVAVLLLLYLDMYRDQSSSVYCS